MFHSKINRILNGDRLANDARAGERMLKLNDVYGDAANDGKFIANEEY